ncbi:hypothetical protein [Cereibacter sphaeroides]|jgi:hypothetical protein|uniref:hypothetical protein n=1 Tax=Cereibacter sphaeroides TaxID=1063 RepID=UPI000066415D|nr:hypothetical protein Rsph17029_0675 [Cereibacter sphaeroides ATCC 17029]
MHDEDHDDSAAEGRFLTQTEAEAECEQLPPPPEPSAEEKLEEMAAALQRSKQALQLVMVELFEANTMLKLMVVRPDEKSRALAQTYLARARNVEVA